MATKIWVNIGSGNGLLPDGTKPLPEAMLTWSSLKSSDIHIRTILQKMHQPSITKICFKITCLKFHSNFPGANEFIEFVFAPRWSTRAASLTSRTPSTAIASPAPTATRFWQARSSHRAMMLRTALTASESSSLRSAAVALAPSLVSGVLVVCVQSTGSSLIAGKSVIIVQMMACCLFGTKPLPEPILTIVYWPLRKKHQWNLNKVIITFSQEITFKNVCKFCSGLNVLNITT